MSKMRWGSSKMAQERLGHASITITLDLYSQATDTMQNDAAARLDAAFQAAIPAGERNKMSSFGSRSAFLLSRRNSKMLQCQ